VLNTTKVNQTNKKCFQLSCVAWSNLYLGKVARTAIENRIIKIVLKTKIVYVNTWFIFIKIKILIYLKN
jgi:hypothetical protein